MKQLCLILSICILITGIGGIIPVCAGEAQSAVVVEYAEYKGTADMYVASQGKGDGDDSCNDPDRATYFKFDLQQYINLDYNIVGAKLLMNITAPYASQVFVHAYDCPDNDLSVTNPTAAVPGIAVCYGTPTPLSPGVYPALTGATIYGNTISDASAFNAEFDLSNYVKNKLNSGNESFTVELYPAFAGSIYYLTSKPVLYLAVDGVNAAPVVDITSPAEGKNVYEGTSFDFTVNVTDDRGVASVDLYYDGIKLENVTNEGADYTATIDNALLGDHTLKAVAVDVFGKKTECVRTVTSTKFILKNSFVEPYVYSNTEEGNPDKSADKTDGEWVISSVSPERYLYYGYDVSALVKLGYDIEKAWILGKSKVSGGSISLYDLNSELSAGANIDTVPSHNSAVLATVDMSGLTALNPADYMHPENDYDFGINIADYNFSADITDYVKDKAENNAGKFGIVAKTTETEKTYTLPEHLIVCLKFSGKNMQPTVVLNSPSEDRVVANNTVKFSINAIDEDGVIEDVKFYVDDVLTAHTSNGDEYYIEVANLEVKEEAYVFKAIVTDDGGKSVTVTKGIYIVNQIINELAGVITATNYVQILHPNGPLQSYQSAVNKWLWGNAGLFLQACAMKFDISSLAGYDIEKVEILTPGDTNNKLGVTASIQQLESDDWDNTLTYADLPSYNKPIATTNADSNIIKKLSENGYSGINDAYMLAFDITDSVKEDINNGKMIGSYLISVDTGMYCLGNTLPVLYVTYKDNKKPVIKVNNPAGSIVAPSEDLLLSATVTDTDSKIASVECEFDGDALTLIAEGDNYSAAINGAEVTAGEHIITIRATDNAGAETVYIKKIYATNYRIDSKVFSDGTGGKAVIKPGNNIAVSMNVLSSENNLKLTVILALYDENNTMRALDYKDKTFNKGDPDSINASITVPSDIDFNRATVKAFVIDNFSDINILDGITTLK